MSASPETPPEAPDERKAQRKKRLLIDLTLLGAIVAAGFIGFFHWQGVTNSAEAEVLEYVHLIESGRIEEATKMVPIRGTVFDTAAYDASEDQAPSQSSGPLLDPALVSDELYAQAEATLVIDEVVGHSFMGINVASGQTTTVDVRYYVGGSLSSVTLEVKRNEDGWFWKPQWTIVDSLALPVHVPIEGTAPRTLPVNDSVIAVSPTFDTDQSEYSSEPPTGEVSTMMYPGQYVLGGVSLAYVRALPRLFTVAESTALDTPYEDLMGGYVSVPAKLEPTPALTEFLDLRLAEFLAQCATAEGQLNQELAGNNCPYPLSKLIEKPSGVGDLLGSVDVVPTIAEIVPTRAPQDSVGEDPAAVFAFASTEGTGRVSGADGSRPFSSTFTIRGLVFIAGDDVRILFEWV